MFKVLIVESDPMARRLFEIYVNNSRNYTLTYSVEGAAMAEAYCLKNSVDLILMDVSGLEVAARIKKCFPEIRIIITSCPQYNFVERAKSIGADSFWYKSPEEDELLSVMDRTVAGEHVYPEMTPTLKMGCALSIEFTDRELDVLRELITGDTNKEIADRLNMSQYTVRDYIQSMLEKTGFRNRTELAVKARECGFVIEQ